VGSSFDPYKDLKLDNTVLEGTYSSRMTSALKGYNRISPFLGSGFIVAFVLGLGAPTTMLLAQKAPRAALVSVALSAVSTVFLLAATASATAVMKELAHAMEAEFSAIGIHTKTGKLTYPAWAAFAFSVLATLTLILIARKVPQKKELRARDLKGKAPSLGPISSKPSTMTMATSHTAVNSQHSVPTLRDPQPPPRLPMVGKGIGDRGFGAGFGMGGSGMETDSSRRDSEMSNSGAAGSYNSNSSRVSGGDKIISESDLSNTRRKELPLDPQSGYMAYRPLQGNAPRY